MYLLWLTRFELNLACRPVDLEEIRRTVPELLDENFEPRSPRILFRSLRYIEYWDELREWAQNVQHEDKEADQSARSSTHCPLKLCPLRNGTMEHYSEPASSLQASDKEHPVFQLMTLGGKVGAREASAKRRETNRPNSHFDSMSEFSKLLSKVHPADEGKNIVSVILTDPYLHMGFDVGGNYLFKYLKSIGLSKGTKATLKICPRIKKSSAGFKKIENSIKSEYQNIVLTHHAQNRRFHDRFFLVQYSNGVARGVFGPSINSLASDDVYLMGELEPHCITTLKVRDL